MKICLINSLFEPPVEGGVEVYVKALAEGLSKNHEVLVLTTCPYSGWGNLRGKTGHKEQVKVIRFFPLNIFYGYNARHRPAWARAIWHIFNTWNPHPYALVKHILRREKPDIVHSHCIRALSPSVLSAVASLGIPHVHTLHDYELLSPWGNLLRQGRVIDPGGLGMAYIRLTQFASRKIRFVTAGTAFVMDLHAKYGLFHKAEKFVIPALSGVPHDGKVNKDYRNLNILFVGDISRHKGVHILLDAFASLPGPGVRLDVVGQGPLVSQVLDLASRDSRVKYHGYLPHGEALWNLYTGANLFVMPSIWLEPQGLVATEAFSFGTPVIGSAIGGIPEVVQNGYNGLLFKAGDADDLTRTIRRALSDTKLLEKMGENARESLARYSLDAHLVSLFKVYEAALKQKAKV
jgi:glycosyltransferase involved in cell wall biosynthesis